MEEIKARIVLIGDSLVGKTSIVTSYKEGNLNQLQMNTIGAVLHKFQKNVNEKEITLEVYDTAGQEKYRSLGPIYYRDAVGALAVFDLTNRDSFTSLSNWISTFRESTDDSFVYIVANKVDLKEWKISMEEATNFAEYINAKLYYTSAVSGDGLNELFDSLFEHFGNENENSNKSKQLKERKNGSGCC